jgi:hypothetical protein
MSSENEFTHLDQPNMSSNKPVLSPTSITSPSHQDPPSDLRTQQFTSDQPDETSSSHHLNPAFAIPQETTSSKLNDYKRIKIINRCF